MLFNFGLLFLYFDMKCVQLYVVVWKFVQNLGYVDILIIFLFFVSKYCCVIFLVGWVLVRVCLIDDIDSVVWLNDDIFLLEIVVSKYRFIVFVNKSFW